MQSKKGSLMETVVTTLTGLVFAMGTTQLGSYLGFWTMSLHMNMVLTAILTIISIIQKYLWRRVFNKLESDDYDWEDERYDKFL